MDQESFKKHLVQSILELIRIELQSLPREEWKRTVKTWSKICVFAKSMMSKPEVERFEFYKRHNFDPTMVHISESVIEKLHTAISLGLVSPEDKPDKIIRLALEVADQKDEINTFIGETLK
jgi:hypothetical protein